MIMLTPTTPHLGHPLSVQKIFLKTGTRGERDRELRPFGSATGAHMAFLVLLFLSYIFMIFTIQSETCFPILDNIHMLFTQTFLPILKTTSTTLNSILMPPLKTLSYGHTTKMVLILQKVGTLGFSPSQNQIAWSWIWKLKAPKKYKFLVCLACHDAVPTLALLHNRKIAPSATCIRCGAKKLSFIVYVIALILKSFGTKSDF